MSILPASIDLRERGSAFVAPGEPFRVGPGAPIERLAIDAESAGAADDGWSAAEERLRQLASQGFVRRVAGLPDLHWKADMELPSSVAVDCGDYLVPNVTSVAMNDCMSLILTDWRRDQMTPDVLRALFESVNRRASNRRSRPTAYSPSQSELPDMLYEGAAAAVRKYQLPGDLLDAIERRGQLPLDDVGPRELARLVPKLLLRHPSFRAEFGLNFGGNHFLEVQTVRDLVDPVVARQWNLSPDQVTLMTHLGPGPFTGNLLHLYARRTKIRPARRVAYLAMKVPLHFWGRHESSVAARYRAYINPPLFAGFPCDSEIGRDLDRVIRLGCNFGYAYQVGCYKAVLDSLADTSRELHMPDPQARMLWSVSHNHIFRESTGAGEAFVGRHNAVRSYAGKPALVSGRDDVDTCVGLGLAGGARFLHSYDHGVGALVGRAERAGTLANTAGHSTGYSFRRGQPHGLEQVVERPLRERRLMEQAVAALEEQQILRPVCYLQPLGTMRN